MSLFSVASGSTVYFSLLVNGTEKIKGIGSADMMNGNGVRVTKTFSYKFTESKLQHATTHYCIYFMPFFVCSMTGIVRP